MEHVRRRSFQQRNVLFTGCCFGSVGLLTSNSVRTGMPCSTREFHPKGSGSHISLPFIYPKRKYSEMGTLMDLPFHLNLLYGGIIPKPYPHIIHWGNIASFGETPSLYPNMNPGVHSRRPWNLWSPRGTWLGGPFTQHHSRPTRAI